MVPARGPSRQQPAEEVIRELPGAGSRELPFQRDINSESVGGGGEQYTQE